jgi:hypothetical protein
MADIVRCPSRKATPYLRHHYDMIIAPIPGVGHPPRCSQPVLDVCAGNGRNTAFMRVRRHSVLPLDQSLPGRCSAHWGQECDLSRGLPRRLLESPPHCGPFGIVLLQYALMFFTNDQVWRLLTDIVQVCADDAVIVIEMQDVKSRVWGRGCMPAAKMLPTSLKYLNDCQRERNLSSAIGHRWAPMHKTKWRAIMQKVELKGHTRP